ncbi:MAG: hypothetical protein MZU79_05860 [Anaerotruncus sp.]|nr:hypothetical protein [Anaerotruncus sp.]
MDCKTKPCMVACPAHNDIPGALKLIKQQNLDEARALWAKTSVLPEMCGALCQNETLCVGSCTLNKLKKPIKIGEIEEALAHYRPLSFTPHPQWNGKTHLVIGLGPSGIANAIRMAEAEYRVVAMDRQKQIGGSVNNLVPDFRYDKHELARLQERLIDLGVDLRQGVDVGESVKLKDLFKQYDSVFIGHGLDSPQIVPVATDGVEPYYAVDLLDKHNYTPDQLDVMLGKRRRHRRVGQRRRRHGPHAASPPQKRDDPLPPHDRRGAGRQEGHSGSRRGRRHHQGTARSDPLLQIRQGEGPRLRGQLPDPRGRRKTVPHRGRARQPGQVRDRRSDLRDRSSLERPPLPRHGSSDESNPLALSHKPSARLRRRRPRQPSQADRRRDGLRPRGREDPDRGRPMKITPKNWSSI